MARVNKGVIVGLAREHWESFHRSRAKALALDAWETGQQYEFSESAGLDPSHPLWGRPYSPREDVSTEYEDLMRRSVSPWAGLIVTTLAQTIHLEGIRLPGTTDDLKTWQTFVQNRWLSKQNPLHRSAIGKGQAFGVVMPGTNPLTGDKMARMFGRSAMRMAAFYADDDDEFPMFAIEADPYELRNDNGTIEHGWNVTLYDEVAAHFLTVKGDGQDEKDWEYVSFEPHPMKVTPVARLANRLDLDGRATGEIEPVIPMLQRVDQDTFDRLIVQRFGAWKVRWIAGMARPSSTQIANIQALKLKVEDLLISSDVNTKFGTLDATPMDGFIKANDADLRMLSAVTQTPPHHLLGLSSNLQAEALAAAESGLQRKGSDFRLGAGDFHCQMARMVAVVNGDLKEARSFDMKARFRDTESRSMSQAADALGKIAVQLKVPVEMLWEKLPGWSDGDTERAKKIIEAEDSIDAMLAEIFAERQTEQAEQAAALAAKSEDSGGDDSDK